MTQQLNLLIFCLHMLLKTIIIICIVLIHGLIIMILVYFWILAHQLRFNFFPIHHYGELDSILFSHIYVAQHVLNVVEILVTVHNAQIQKEFHSLDHVCATHQAIINIQGLITAQLFVQLSQANNIMEMILLEHV